MMRLPEELDRGSVQLKSDVPSVAARRRLAFQSLIPVMLMSFTFASAVGAQAAVVVKPGEGAAVDSVLRVAEATGFSGVVLAFRNNDVVLRKGYGMADRAAKRPMTPSTVVQIGSNTKDFTA